MLSVFCLYSNYLTIYYIFSDHHQDIALTEKVQSFQNQYDVFLTLSLGQENTVLGAESSLVETMWCFFSFQ